MYKILVFGLALVLFSSLKPSEVNYQSIESVVNTSLACISGDQGVPRNFELFKTLYHKDAKLCFIQKGDSGKEMGALTIDKFTEVSAQSYEAYGFYEAAIKNTIDSFGSIANVFQSYEASVPLKDYKIRGINSYQLVFEKGRWWIINEIYDEEKGDLLIPEKYLK